ncbi:histidine--tRNA ligase [Holzapfeliella sp. JNUCC 80]
MKLQKPKGTVDILPGESNRWQYVETEVRNFMDLYDFNEIRTPIFEQYELFARSSGESSDVVSKEMYDFFDKGERHIALRPEGTAGTVRSYVENKLYAPEHEKPVKLFYIGPMFRYERPQAGRQRQFHQIGVEAFGATHPMQDVEIILLAHDLLKKLNVQNFELHLNSLGNAEVRKNYHEALVNYFEPFKDELSDDSKQRLQVNPLRILDSKDKRDQELVADAPKLRDYLDDETNQHFGFVLNMLDELGINYQIDDNLVRGLDYYTGTIFEFMIEDKNLWQSKSTVLAGGRYDKLVEEFSGPETPAIGFGIGFERLMLVLQQQNPEMFATEGPEVYIANVGDDSVATVLKLARSLRNQGLKVVFDVSQRKLKNQFKSADRHQAKYILTIGDQEVEKQAATLKNLEDGSQTVVDFESLNKNASELLKEIN